MTEPINSLLVFTKHWGFVGRHKVFPDDVLPLVFAFLVDAQSISNIQRTCRTTRHWNYDTLQEWKLDWVYKNIEKNCNDYASINEIKLSFFQSNIEGEIVDQIQRSRNNHDGLIINAGGYTHTSVAIADAVAAIESPVIEVHISNVYARESYRHESKMAKHCKGVIAGLGLNVYKLAIISFLEN